MRNGYTRQRWHHTMAKNREKNCTFSQRMLRAVRGMRQRRRRRQRQHDGTSAIPKTLKEFILIKIKTSFKTPNNDTQRKRNENATNEWNGNERLCLLCNGKSGAMSLVALTDAAHQHHRHLPRYLHLIYPSYDFYFGQYRGAHRRHCRAMVRWHGGQVIHFFIC